MEDAVDRIAQQKKAGPGETLRAAREARKLTIEAVSHQMHVDATIVRALEQDDYEKFAAPIFVTGHLRAYARLLDLPPEPLIEAYHRLGVDTPPPLKQVKRRLSFDSKSSLVPGIVVVLVLGIAIALFASIQNGERGAVESTQDSAVEPSGPDIPTPFEPPPTAENMPPSDASGGAAPAPDPNGVPAPPATTEIAPVPAGARATLSLRADQASWVEVRDAGGRRLLYDLLDPGTSRNIEGTAPFAVVLGYGRGVTVEFNGKLVDHTRYVRDDVARFRVGERGIDKL